MEWALRALGAFYALAGVLYAFNFARDGVINKAMHSLKVERTATERTSAVWLKIMAALTVASGLALLTLSVWAAPLMILNTLVQGGWLFWAHRALPPQDADEQIGRKRTINAFVVWCLATLLAVSLFWSAQTPAVTTGAGNWLPAVGGLIFLIWMLMQ